MPLTSTIIRRAYQRELLPTSLRWTLVAAAMRDWIRGVAKALREEHPDSRELIGRTCATLFETRYRALRRLHPALPSPSEDPRAVAKLMAGLYQIEVQPRAAWIFDALGGAPRGLRERAESVRLVLRLNAEERWIETATHLGQLLITMTETLPGEIPRARRRLGQICFQMGADYARRIARYYNMPESGNRPQQAIEILRMGEYIFRVNPSHHAEADAATRMGMLEGNACLWVHLPGWERGHCGIFGQFQGGIASVFGLSYKLEQTIPKHGGDLCRVRLRPLD